MSDLLALAVEARGGLQRCDEFKTLRAELSVDGAIWRIKQQPACSPTRSSRSRLMPNG